MPDWRQYVRDNLRPLQLGVERELEMVDEIAQHLEAVYEDALNDGATPQEAFKRATSHIKDWQLLECELIRAKHPITHKLVNKRLAADKHIESRWGKGGFRMGSLSQDIRYGARMMLKNKAFTVIAVLSLALGIGANTALFSLVDAMLLKKLPVKNPNELVLFNWLSGPRGMSRGLNGTITTDPATGMRTSTSFSYLTFERFRDQNETLANVFAFARLYQLNVSVDSHPEIAQGQLVSGGYYSGLGVGALKGRTINQDDDDPAAAPVTTISYSYWQRRFDSDPDIVGKTVVVNNVPFTVIGITPAGFSGAMQIGQSADVTIPFAMEPRLSQGESDLRTPWVWWVQIMGRLKPGVTRIQAATSFERIFQQSAEEGWNAALARFPPRNPSQPPAPRDVPQLRAESGSQGQAELRRAYSEPLKILLAIVGLVLLIACTNVANLLLARGATRQKEIAVRLAVGASRGRLVRQLLTESVLLFVLSGIAGVIFAYWGKDLLLNLRPWGPNELTLALKIDLRVLAFTLAVSLVTGLVFGLAPALRATRVDLTSMLKDNARSVVRGHRSFLTKSLIIAQVSMSLVLLIGAGLFVRTLRNLQNVDVGFNREDTLLFNVEPGLNGYSKAQLAQLYEKMTERLEALPGVKSTSVSLIPLLGGYGRTSSISVQGHAAQQGDDDNAKVNNVSEHFFTTTGMNLLIGRGITAHDDENSPKVAVVNQKLARKYFGDESPIGHRLGFGGVETSGQIEIVGVVGDAKYTDIRSEIEPTVFLPYRQSVPSSATFIVRTFGNPTALTPIIRDAVHDIDGNLPIFAVKTQKQQSDESLMQERMFATLSSFFGVLALMLSCIGIYGVMSYGVARRTNEIGIRMALGATAPRVVKMVLLEAMLVVGIGTAIGLGAAIALARLIETMLFGLAATDLVTVTGAVLLMVVVAAVSGYLPARRASRVDPMIALRYE